MFAQLAAKVRQDLMPRLQLDPEVTGWQDLDDAPLKLYMLFATHGGANLTRSTRLGQ